MGRRVEKLARIWTALSAVDKTFLIALAVEILYGVLGAARFSQPASGLVRIAFVIIFIVFVIRSGPRLIRKLLWRVRRRLIVTWILVGVVPITLVSVLLAEAVFMLMGQVVGYMTTTEISRRSDSIHGAAYALAWNLAHRPASATASELAEVFIREAPEARGRPTGAVVRVGKDVVAVPASGAIRDIPKWTKPDYAGLVEDRRNYFLAADAQVPSADGDAEVFLYQSVPAEFFQNLLPDVAAIIPVEGTATTSGIEIRRTEKTDPKVTIQFSRRPSGDPDVKPATPPPGRGAWDVPVRWFVVLPSMNLSTGERDNSIAVFGTRPSLIVKKLFTSVGAASFAIALALLILTAMALLIVEVASILFGAKLTRSITRAVGDIYEGTQKVQAGDLSHRIPVRKTKDQLSDLAGSFNAMTERVQGLIVEAEEKQRLENELAIARDVQSTLFPKESPSLRTVEFWGQCQPARAVSGDYYDFISTPSHQIALAISDISGKGISAALLMAHIQSALRSQFTGSAEAAPSKILSILNDHLYASSPPEKYATCFLGVYNDDSGELIYTNAGHLPPMLVRAGKIQRLAGDGLPVGLFPGVQYEQHVARLDPGDLLVAFTDGITEAPNAAGEEFGDDRFADLLLRVSEKPLNRIGGDIGAAVEEWAGGVEQHDDTTVLLARRLS